MDRADAATHGTRRPAARRPRRDDVCQARRRTLNGVDERDTSGADGPSTPRHHRPERHADLTAMIDAGGGDWPASRAELAAATAEVVVRAGRTPGDAAGGDAPSPDLVDLADRVGLDTLAALWRDADPVSLPGALWALYLLRQWSHSDADEVTRLWRLGEPYAPADAVVAGVPAYADAPAVRDLVDAVLAGAYAGEFDVALERAAAFFRVVAAGRRAQAGVADPQRSAAAAGSPSDPTLAPALELAGRNDRAAASLAAAAARWRAGTLH